MAAFQAPKRRSAGTVVAVAAALAILVLGVSAMPAPFKMMLAQNFERRLAGLRLGALEVDGMPIAYLVGGAGEPLLLVHGFGGDKDNWTRMARHLTGEFRVHAIDLPGFGESTRDPRLRYGFEDQVERVDAIATALGLEQFHIAGNSMGGMIAGLYAAEHPERVKSVTLYAPGGVTRAKQSDLQAAWEKNENPLLVDDAEDFDALLHFIFVEPPWVPTSILDYLAHRAVADRPLHEAILKELRASKLALEDELAGSKVPLLVVWGDQDRLLHVSGAEVLRSVRADAKVLILPNVGHVPMVERPEESAQAMADFVKSHAQLGSAAAGS